MEPLLLPIDLHTNNRLIIVSIFNIEWPKLLVFLDDILIESPANQSFNVIDRICGVPGRLILGSLADEPLTIAKSNVAWSDVMTHVILNYMHLVLPPDANTGIGRAKIDANPGVARVIRICEYHFIVCFFSFYLSFVTFFKEF